LPATAWRWNWQAAAETESALDEFSTLLANDPDYTAAYFMAAQTVANEARVPEAIGATEGTVSHLPNAPATIMLSARCRP